jgi:hypothetical protein
VDSEFDAATPAWMDMYGHQLVAQMLYTKVFKVPDWYRKELRVRFLFLAPVLNCVPTVICFTVSLTSALPLGLVTKSMS